MVQEIFPGNKKKHFKRIHEQTSIPYRDMVCQSPSLDAIQHSPSIHLFADAHIDTHCALVQTDTISPCLSCMHDPNHMLSVRSSHAGPDAAVLRQ